MDSYAIVITILVCLCILVVLYLIAKRIKKEHFEEDVCTFTYDATEHTTREICLNECYTTDKCGKDCATICKDTIRTDPCVDKNGMTICNINSVNDIDGETQNQCVTNCELNTIDCKGCSEFNIFDPITGRTLQGKYSKGDSAITDFKEKCDSSADNHSYCSPCAKACYYCTDPNRCRWLPGSGTKEKQELERIEFRSQLFQIHVIPDDGKVTIVWTESNTHVGGYKIFIYEKADVNKDGTGKQQTPLTIRTDDNSDTKLGHKSHEINGLVNGVTYSINVNKISNHTQMLEVNNEKYMGPEIISSNTIDVVPSPVNLINFSRINRDNTLKQRDLLSVGLLKELTGKTFDIVL
jgi:hypothetical protein